LRARNSLVFHQRKLRLFDLFLAMGLLNNDG